VETTGIMAPYSVCMVSSYQEIFSPNLCHCYELYCLYQVDTGIFTVHLLILSADVRLFIHNSTEFTLLQSTQP